MLPKTISDRYELYKQEESWGQSSAKKGLYIDKKIDRVVFIKVDTNNKLLFREYKYQQFFWEQSRELKPADIIVPKPLGILKVDNSVALVMEYFPAKALLKVDVKTRLDAYMKVLKFLEKINTTTDISKKHALAQKSATWQLITLLYFLSKNLILYLPYASLFLRSTVLIAKAASKWTKLTSNWICHGDINVTNVLLYGEKVILLDFACSYRSHRYFDISRVLSSTWYQEKFHQQLWDHIVSEFRFNTYQQNLLKSFVVFNLLERLSQRYTNLSQESFYLKRLKKMLA